MPQTSLYSPALFFQWTVVYSQERLGTRIWGFPGNHSPAHALLTPRQLYTEFVVGNETGSQFRITRSVHLHQDMLFFCIEDQSSASNSEEEQTLTHLSHFRLLHHQIHHTVRSKNQHDCKITSPGFRPDSTACDLTVIEYAACQSESKQSISRVNLVIPSLVYQWVNAPRLYITFLLKENSELFLIFLNGFTKNNRTYYCNPRW